jgi:hypothetical protein
MNVLKLGGTLLWNVFMLFLLLVATFGIIALGKRFLPAPLSTGLSTAEKYATPAGWTSNS